MQVSYCHNFDIDPPQNKNMSRIVALQPSSASPSYRSCSPKILYGFFPSRHQAKDSLYGLMTRREKAIENLWRTRMIRSQKALRCQSRRAHIEVKEGWENETQVMDMSYVPAVQRNECVLNQGPPPKTDHFNFGNWILRLQSIHAYEHANNTVLTNKQNPLKHLKTLLCEFLHTLKSKSPADTTSSPKRIPEPVSSMLPDRLSATKFDKCQVATTLSLVYCKIM